MPFFSVISCLYNMSTFFQTGLNCLLEQTFKDYEIILVDDGSTDSTSSLADKALDLSAKIRVLHQKNAGLGAARNTGIKAAKGRYLCFYDMDDKVNSDWLEIIHRYIADSLPQIAVFGYREINKWYDTCPEFIFPNVNLSSNAEIGKVFPRLLSGLKFNNGFVWNKVYNRDFVLKYDIHFPDLRIQQDEVFNHKAYMHADSLLMVPDVLYEYYVYESGNNRSRFVSDRLQCFITVRNSFLNLLNYWDCDDSNVINYIHSRFISNSLFNRNPRKNFKTHKQDISGILESHEIEDSLAVLRTNNFRGFSLWLRLYTWCIGLKSWRGMFLIDCMFALTRVVKDKMNFIRRRWKKQS